MDRDIEDAMGVPPVREDRLHIGRKNAVSLRKSAPEFLVLVSGEIPALSSQEIDPVVEPIGWHIGELHNPP
ncbi:hypothetical protein [Phaeovulum vinaykumarii]|uniref:hypothetical protein n=1 Tax=Phaeovulum vinaykumarii TaxID=407234 RepID=UPI00117A1B8C|nr:hypothetical protein [Phaeovulum vinaykumarii]